MLPITINRAQIVAVLALAALALMCAAPTASGQSVPKASKHYPAPSYQTVQWWINQARNDINTARSIANNLQRGRAKNVVLFVGDGLGMTTTMAGRVYKGQLAGHSGEEAQLTYETFPHIGLAKTYDVNYQTPDSAATATAFSSGVKTNDAMLGVNQNVVKSDCNSYDSSKNLYSFLHYAKLAGKSVGLVTTTRITHATPAATYAHSPNRGWEYDAKLPAGVDRTRCPDIASQLVSNAADFNVVFGGGRAYFLSKNQTTIDYSNGNAAVSGSRGDGIDLINRWRSYQNARARRYAYVESKSQFDSIDTTNTDHVLGLFSMSHMRYQLDNEKNPTYKEPSLSEMVDKAIRILSRNPNGFALFVESGRIDHAHHDNYVKKALHDLLELDQAVAKARSLTSQAETLTVVTGDHSHVFTVGGWGMRGNPILDKVYNSDKSMYNSKGDAVADDGMPYTVLNYADGPSATVLKQRENLTDTNTTEDRFQFPALYKYEYESHGAEDVPVYAVGPSAYLFHSTHEQSYIGNVIMYALCIGTEGTTWCAGNDVVMPTGYPMPSAGSRLHGFGLLAPLLAPLVAFVVFPVVGRFSLSN